MRKKNSTTSINTLSNIKEWRKFVRLVMCLGWQSRKVVEIGIETKLILKRFQFCNLRDNWVIHRTLYYRHHWPVAKLSWDPHITYELIAKVTHLRNFDIRYQSKKIKQITIISTVILPTLQWLGKDIWKLHVRAQVGGQLPWHDRACRMGNEKRGYHRQRTGSSEQKKSRVFGLGKSWDRSNLQPKFIDTKG